MPTKPSSVSNTRSARPRSFITSPHCRSCRRLDHRRRGRAVPVLPRASPPPSMRLFLPKTDPCWAKLWHRKSRTAGHQVLEEWRHWLEGASSPFTVITDHNNLQYLRDARHLNHLSIFPSPTIPEARTPRQMHSPDQPSEPEPDLPPALIIMGTHQEHPWRHPHWASSTGRPRRKDARTILPAFNPSGLSSRSTGLWTPRQPANPLAPSSSVLVAQYGRGCHPVRLQLLSLCHVEDPLLSSGWQAGSSACSPKTLVTNRGRLRHGSPKFWRSYVRACLW